MDIQQIINALPPEEAVGRLREKSTQLPAWYGKGGLLEQYDPERHPVMDKQRYPDLVQQGVLIPVTRITYDLQRLAVHRMSELICGIPVKRIYHSETEEQKLAAQVVERIFERNRIDTVNIERTNALFASCEVMTLWYAVDEPHKQYGVQSPIKVRCRTFSPMQGDQLYPLFDEYGDLQALSVGYTRRVGNKDITYLDCYTKDRHIKYSGEEQWHVEVDEPITLQKIPGVYCYRPTPIWENTSRLVYEMEWAISRNGNYLRENSKPLFVVFADEEIAYGDEKPVDREYRAVMQYPKGSTAQYITWQQAADNLKYYISELRQSFFTQLQLPDWSYESMKSTPMSGESRKQLFIDAQLKVKEEGGRLLEMFDREVNVVKAFAVAILGEEYREAVESLNVEVLITPYQIDDETQQISNLISATGGKPIISQREAIEQLGWSTDPEKTYQQIVDEQNGLL